MTVGALRLGRWQDVLADVTPDTVIVDAPYSAATHRGHDAAQRHDGAGVLVDGQELTNALTYPGWDEADVSEFVASWSGRTKGWIVTITDHVLAPIWTAHLRAAGRYVFAPLPLVETGSRVRLQGDGPSSWTCWIVVARPRTEAFVRWGTLPGAYVGKREAKTVMGGKPLGLMRSIVRDYSRPGDLICDPCAGGATTLIAALTEGRRTVGAEALPAQYAKALAVMRGGYTPTLDLTGEDREWTNETLDAGTCAGGTKGSSDGER